MKEKETNQLGDAYFNLAALELPGIYQMTVQVSKGPRHGTYERTVKVPASARRGRRSGAAQLS